MLLKYSPLIAALLVLGACTCRNSQQPPRHTIFLYCLDGTYKPYRTDVFFVEAGCVRFVAGSDTISHCGAFTIISQ